mmetsp:Transcript_24573/g.73760  ORF Transcript_24573/g.73760 Transcript_24573/m.73760 type:complete len:223 (-) Transcript_24573:170-838(-)
MKPGKKALVMPAVAVALVLLGLGEVAADAHQQQVELLHVQRAVAVVVDVPDEVVHVVHRELLADLADRLVQLLDRDEAAPVLVDDLEHVPHELLGLARVPDVVLERAPEGEELLEGHLARAVRVEQLHDLVDPRRRRLAPRELGQQVPELLAVDGPLLVLVEDVEDGPPRPLPALVLGPRRLGALPRLRRRPAPPVRAGRPDARVPQDPLHDGRLAQEAHHL